MTCDLFRYLGVAIDKRVAALQVRECKGLFTLVLCLCVMVMMMDDACVTHLRRSIPSLHHLELLWTRSGVCAFVFVFVCAFALCCARVLFAMCFMCHRHVRAQMRRL